MGKKGSKRKTRWRTLSIGAAPGEEDEEEGLRKDCVKTTERETNVHIFDRNVQGNYKSRRFGNGNSNTSNSYPGNGSKAHRDESTDPSSQPKIIFNEDEYTKITTPRQDVLFKKGYLSRRKPIGHASTSATPSTTESQSASHSTADGSETTEDQQLLDRDSGTGEYAPVVDPGAQLGYGTYYDPTTGYYYEYPLMLVGPAPVPAHVAPSVLTAVPCTPVPLRPIEWINPAFVPKLANQSYCLMNYQTNQYEETATIMEEQNDMVMATEACNGTTYNENGIINASYSDNIASETEEHAEEMDNSTDHTMEQVTGEQHPITEEQHFEEQHLENVLENGVTTVNGYIDPIIMQEPMHIQPIMSAVPQPYMYPGHYMFGPPLVNVNGVTIQGGPLLRTTDVSAMTMAFNVKRRKKRKKKKQRRPTLGNAEDEEEAEYSSECDNDASSSRIHWSECPDTITTTTSTNRPLNPECQEFQLRPSLQPHLLSNPASAASTVPAVDEEAPSHINNVPDVSSVKTEVPDVSCRIELTHNASTADKNVSNQENISSTICCSEEVVSQTLLENHLTTAKNKSKTKNVEINGQAIHVIENTEVIVGNETTKVQSNEFNGHEMLSRIDTAENSKELISANMKQELLNGENSDHVNIKILNHNVECLKEGLNNGETDFKHSTEEINVLISKSKSVSPRGNSVLSEKVSPTSATCNINSTTRDVNAKAAQSTRQCNNSLGTRVSFVLPKKYSKKGSKFVREPTPGPDLESITTHMDMENGKIIQQFEGIELSDDTSAVADFQCSVVKNKLNQSDQEVPDTSHMRDDESKILKMDQETIEGSNEDSGFESQTQRSKYPITHAVTEWLRRKDPPDIFAITVTTSDSETDDDREIDTASPKNLQGNPMPALSANGSVDDITLSGTASCGEFAKTNKLKIHKTRMNGVSVIGKRNKNTKGNKREAAKRINNHNKNIDEKTQSQLVSSLITDNQSENSITAVRIKNPPNNNVGDVCEFTQKDSVAGMRVALSSRINSKKVNARRSKTSRKINGDSIEDVDVRMRRIDDVNRENSKEMVEDTMTVRTFEKGEIVVSTDGKLLPTSTYEFVPPKYQDVSVYSSETIEYADIINKNTKTHEEIRDNSENDESGSVMMSSVSIEEPDVLECWEAETIEPVITPKRMLQSPGILCEGEDAEEDNFDIKKTAMEQVQKYYRLSRDNIVDIEEESSEFKISIASSKLRTVPNNSEGMLEQFCNKEEIPVIIPEKTQNFISEGEEISVDEAFEVYESFYTGKSSFLPFDYKMFKQRSLYTQNGEGPIPCRAVCCNIQ